MLLPIDAGTDRRNGRLVMLEGITFAVITVTLTFPGLAAILMYLATDAY